MRYDRFFESSMEITGAERQIDDICDSRNKNGGTFFKKPGRYWIIVRFLLGQLERILEISDSVAGLKVEKSGAYHVGTRSTPTSF